MRSTNTSGKKGVGFCKDSWYGSAIINGIRTKKYYAVKLYGNDLAFKLACQYRDEYEQTLEK